MKGGDNQITTVYCQSGDRIRKPGRLDATYESFETLFCKPAEIVRKQTEKPA